MNGCTYRRTKSGKPHEGWPLLASAKPLSTLVRDFFYLFTLHRFRAVESRARRGEGGKGKATSWEIPARSIEIRYFAGFVISVYQCSVADSTLNI